MSIIQKIVTHPVRRHLLIGMLIAVFMAELDQYTKHILLRHFYWTQNPEPIALTSFITLVKAWRPGITLGLFEPYSPHGIWIYRTATALFALLCLWRLRYATSSLMAIGWGLIMGGALGYFADRIQFKAFYHFIEIAPVPAFNLADSAIIVGALLLLACSLKRRAFHAKQGHG